MTVAEMVPRRARLSRLRRGDSVLVGEADRLRPVPGPDLGQQVIDVAFHGRLADHELARDLRVGQASGDELKYLGLTRGEAVGSGRPRGAAAEVPWASWPATPSSPAEGWWAIASTRWCCTTGSMTAWPATTCCSARSTASSPSPAVPTTSTRGSRPSSRTSPSRTTR